MNKYLLAILAVIAAPATCAADYNVTVCALQSHSNGSRAYLMPCESWVSKNSCSSGGWIGWDMTQYGGEAMYSTALAALTSASRITVRLDGESCESQYDATTMIRINRD